MKSKRHEVVLVIRTDKLCTKADAIAIVKDNIWGDFFPAVCDNEAGVGEFKVVTAKARPTKKRR